MTPPSPPPLLSRLAAVALPFDGCVTPTLLEHAGIGRRHQRSLVARGALTVILPRVFIVGGATWVTHRQLTHAGLLAVGGGGRLAGRSALEYRGAAHAEPGYVRVVRDRPHPRAREIIRTLVPVIETGRAGTVLIDTPRRAGPCELVGGWPIEPTARSVRQLAADADERVCARVWREADFLGLLDAGELLAEVGRGRPGSRWVRQQLERCPPRDQGIRLRSRAELALVQALLALGLPRPLVNGTVEVDGEQHELPVRRRADEARDARLRDYGIEVMRFPDGVARTAADACALRIQARRAERLSDLRASAA